MAFSTFSHGGTSLCRLEIAFPKRKVFRRILWRPWNRLPPRRVCGLWRRARFPGSRLERCGFAAFPSFHSVAGECPPTKPISPLTVAGPLRFRTGFPLPQRLASVPERLPLRATAFESAEIRSPGGGFVGILRFMRSGNTTHEARVRRRASRITGAKRPHEPANDGIPARIRYEFRHASMKTAYDETIRRPPPANGRRGGSAKIAFPEI
ncbi:hypothetical protein BH20ACT10_BH20ACT10_11090 [soil metagenome]